MRKCNQIASRLLTSEKKIIDQEQELIDRRLYSRVSPPFDDTKRQKAEQ